MKSRHLAIGASSTAVSIVDTRDIGEEVPGQTLRASQSGQAVHYVEIIKRTEAGELYYKFGTDPAAVLADDVDVLPEGIHSRVHTVLFPGDVVDVALIASAGSIDASIVLR